VFQICNAEEDNETFSWESHHDPLNKQTNSTTVRKHLPPTKEWEERRKRDFEIHH
jgi:hypothetical protein